MLYSGNKKKVTSPVVFTYTKVDLGGVCFLAEYKKPNILAFFIQLKITYGHQSI